MKKLSLSISFTLLLLQFANGQKTIIDSTKANQLTYNEYIGKYKKNRTSGRVLLFPGLGLMLFGGISFASYAGQGFNGPAPVAGENLFIVGTCSSLASIPFFIAAKNNRKKAEPVLKKETAMPGYSYHSNISYTALSLTISF